MSRVEWSRRTADEVESVLGIMLCRDNPHAVRIRPSRGDGGVDIYVPGPDGGVVYQVKSFTGALSSSHKRQIRESWEAFVAFVDERALTVRKWHVVRPENPTWGDIKWLEELTADASYPCSWKGLDYCDALAADHQAVVDYYLFDGKQRLADTLSQVLTAMSAVTGQDAPLQAAEAEEGLRAIHRTINNLDPHYRYDFSVEAVRPDIGDVAEDIPGMVAAVRIFGAQEMVTFRVFARYDGATDDRPIPGSFTLTARDGGPDAEALQDFIDYGTPGTFEAKAVSVDLPGGLGPTNLEATVRVGPSRGMQAVTRKVTLTVLDPDDRPLASVDVVLDPATQGMAGDKFAVQGRETGGVFRLRLRVDTTRRTFNMTISDLKVEGLEPADALNGLIFLDEFRPPNRIEVRRARGPVVAPVTAITAALPGEVTPIRLACEALMILQRHSYETLLVPPLESLTVEEVKTWQEAAALLSGQQIQLNWERVELVMDADRAHDPDAELGDVAITAPLIVRVGELEVGLGQKQLVLSGARALDRGAASSEEGAVTVTLVPSGGGTGVGSISWVREAPSAERGDGPSDA